MSDHDRRKAALQRTAAQHRESMAKSGTHISQQQALDRVTAGVERAKRKKE